MPNLIIHLRHTDEVEFRPPSARRKALMSFTQNKLSLTRC